MKKKISLSLTVILIMQIFFSSNVPIFGLDLGVKAIEQNFKKNIVESNEYVENEVIIMYSKSGVENDTKIKIESFLNGFSIEETIEFKNINQNLNDSDLILSLVSSKKYSTVELLELLNKKEWVKKVWPNYKLESTNLTNDKYISYQWALENNRTNGGKENCDINPIQINSDKEKVIAIIDTGVDYTHADLANVMWENPYNNEELPGKYGYDFVNDDDDPMDDNGHGTHVAGIIAAESNNSEGISGGVLGAPNIKIMALKCGNQDGERDVFSAVSAYNYIYKAQQLGVNVIAINNSWSGRVKPNEMFPKGSESIRQLLEPIINSVGENGALSICSAGNDRLEIDNDGYCNDPIEGEQLYYPMGLNSDYIISVAASNEEDELAWFSNYGSKIDIAAPGTSILSTIKKVDSNGEQIKTFNPSIFTNNQKNEICTEFHNFDNSIDINYEVDAGTVSLCSDKYFGSSGKSLKWTVKTETGGYYTLKIKTKKPKGFVSLMLLGTGPSSETRPLGQIGITTNTSAEYSVMVGEYIGEYIGDVGVNGHKTGYWEHCYNSTNSNIDEIYISLSARVGGIYNLYIDDLAISDKAEDTLNNYIDEDYEFLSGTSMSAPYVAASIATISNVYEDLTALELKEKLLGATRKSEGLEGKVSTGILDMSLLPRRLTEINITSKPIKTDYIEGENFDPTNMTVIATYNDGSSQEITDYQVVDGEDLKPTQQSVTISYTEDGITKTTTQEIMVQAKSLEKIEIKNTPTKTSYYIGETLNTEGLVLTATYNNGDTQEITQGYICTPTILNEVGEQTITVAYEDKETTFTVTVLEAEIEDLETIVSDEYVVEQEGEIKYLSNINPGTIAGEVLNKIQVNAGAKKKVSNGTTEVAVDKILATGMKIVISLNNQVEEYIVVVSGDINGNGSITATDLTKMKNHILGKITLTSVELKAADLNNDGRITATELTKIKKYVLGFNVQLH